VAIKKLEEELRVQLFERTTTSVAVTPLGAEIVRQAQTALEQADQILEIARRGMDPLAGSLRLGTVHTIGPYLLPQIMGRMMAETPQMPLVLEEDLVPRLLEMLRAGDIDCVIVPMQVSDATLRTVPLYDEPFLVAVPAAHPLAARNSVSCAALAHETVLLLGADDCPREPVQKVCPEFGRAAGSAAGLPQRLKGSSLETIKQMVAAGMGITVLPRLSIPPQDLQDGMSRPEEAAIRYLPFAGATPMRRVVLAWRRSYTRGEAMERLLQTIQACELPGVVRLPAEPGPT
jgi:LysR family hydrogen peroxide-inducible transcriptional activator